MLSVRGSQGFSSDPWGPWRSCGGPGQTWTCYLSVLQCRQAMQERRGPHSQSLRRTAGVPVSCSPPQSSSAESHNKETPRSLASLLDEAIKLRMLFSLITDDTSSCSPSRTLCTAEQGPPRARFPATRHPPSPHTAQHSRSHLGAKPCKETHPHRFQEKNGQCRTGIKAVL